MEKWITRLTAALVAAGGLGLFWTFGVFVAVPWREDRLLALSGIEIQVLSVALVGGLAVTWGALHLLSIADREHNPQLYGVLRAALLIASALSVARGALWTTAHLA